MERDPSFSLMDVNSPQITFYIQFISKENSAGVFFSWLYISEKKRPRITNTLMQKRTRLWSGWSHKISQSLLSTMSFGCQMNGVQWKSQKLRNNVRPSVEWSRLFHEEFGDDGHVGKMKPNAYFPSLSISVAVKIVT